MWAKSKLRDRVRQKLPLAFFLDKQIIMVNIQTMLSFVLKSLLCENVSPLWIELRNLLLCESSKMTLLWVASNVLLLSNKQREKLAKMQQRWSWFYLPLRVYLALPCLHLFTNISELSYHKFSSGLEKWGFDLQVKSIMAHSGIFLKLGLMWKRWQLLINELIRNKSCKRKFPLCIGCAKLILMKL